MHFIKPNKKRSQTAIIFIIVVLFCRIAILISSVLQIILLNKATEGFLIYGAEESFTDKRHIILNLIYLSLLLISSFFFIRWFSRAYYNLHKKTNYLSIKKGWSIFSWYTPVINLFIPFHIMRDLYFETYKLLRNESLVPKKIVNFQYVSFWWGTWVFTILSGFILKQFSISDIAIGKIYLIVNWEILNSIIFIISSTLIIKVILDYNKMEKLLVALKSETGEREIVMGNDDLLDSGF